VLPQEIEQLKVHFLSKLGGVISGSITPNQTNQHNLGSDAYRWKTLYVQTLIADNVQGGSGADASTLNGFTASQTPQPNTILPLDGIGVFPVGVYNRALLVDGTRGLMGNLVVGSGYMIDNLDLDIHNHSGIFGLGNKISHTNLLNLDADGHPQYTQRAQDEIVTGDWMFTHLLDRSAGWKFLPDEYTFKAVPHNMAFTATPSEAKMVIGHNNAITILSNSTNAKIQVGSGNSSITLSGTDPNYRLWAGAVLPENATFSVDKNGGMKASGGTIAGWQILSGELLGEHMTLYSGGEIILGDGAINAEREDVTVLSAIDGNGWRLWSGHSDPSLASFKINRWGQAFFKDAYVEGVLRSSNFVSGTSGFHVDGTGRAEFNNITARGRIDAVICAERTISAMSGMLIISEAAALAADVSLEDTYIYVDADAFGKDDILRIQPNRNASEWMRVTSPAAEMGDSYRYAVIRDLSGDGKCAFQAGDTIVRVGTAVQANPMYPYGSGEEGAEYGSYQPAGSGTKTDGGWLVLEGSGGFGPYFGVERRRGPLYDQYESVVRIGNLQGTLDYTEQVYGAVIGNAGQYLAYDQTNGLRIKTRSGAVSIDEDGIEADVFSMTTGSGEPSFVEDRARFYVYRNTGSQPQVGIKIKVDGFEKHIQKVGDMSMEDYDTDRNGVVDLAEAALSAPWSGLTGTPSAFTPAAHTHAPNDIVGIENAMDMIQRSWFGL
jgi:hypothetical protein